MLELLFPGMKMQSLYAEPLKEAVSFPRTVQTQSPESELSETVVCVHAPQHESQLFCVMLAASPKKQSATPAVPPSIELGADEGAAEGAAEGGGVGEEHGVELLEVEEELGLERHEPPLPRARGLQEL